MLIYVESNVTLDVPTIHSTKLYVAILGELTLRFLTSLKEGQGPDQAKKTLLRTREELTKIVRYWIGNMEISTNFRKAIASSFF